MPSAKCRSCGAEIEWAYTREGKLMPLDLQPDPEHGNLRVVGRTKGVPVMDHVADQGDRISHFATCPNATRHRKKPAKE